MKFIKKMLPLILLVCLLVSTINPVMANDNITVNLNGQQIVFDVQPQIINDRTMVPLRAIFEALGATVEWNSDMQTVTSSKENTTISLMINDSTMYVNGTAITLDSPACIIDDRTLVPVRAISEAFGANVTWDGSTRTVDIKTADYKEVIWYSDNMYRIGIDIPAGDYYVVVTEDNYGGYYCKYEDSSQDKIEDNDNFNSFTFFRCYDGQYLKLSRCKITPIENAPINSSSDGIYGEGTYRVGIDIPEGEYKFLSTDSEYSGYYCVYTDISYKDIENNDNFDGTSYYTVYDGQYLKISRATAQKIGEAPSSDDDKTALPSDT